MSQILALMAYVAELAALGADRRFANMDFLPY